MLSRSLRKMLILAATVLFAFPVLIPPSQGRDNPGDKGLPVILWVREVHGQAFYWVDDKPARRAPLSGLVERMGSNESVALTVIVDSHVPIQEVSDIGALLEKIPIRNARYYVYRADEPIGMWEILLKDQTMPLPARPPK